MLTWRHLLEKIGMLPPQGLDEDAFVLSYGYHHVRLAGLAADEDPRGRRDLTDTARHGLFLGLGNAYR